MNDYLVNYPYWQKINEAFLLAAAGQKLSAAGKQCT